MILLNQIMSAVLQLLIFLSIPFVWYLLTQKRVTGFFKWLGLKTAPTPLLYPCGIFSGTIFTLSVALSIWQFELSRIYSGRISTNRLEHRNIYSHLDLGCRSDFLIGRNSLSWVSLQAVVQ